MTVVDADAYVVSTEDLETIAADVWTAFLLGEGEPLLPVADDGVRGTDVVNASVGVHGTWNGAVVLELSSTAAHRAATAMLGVTEVDPADVADAVGELVNMVGGNVKSLVPAPSTLGLPMVVEGRVTRSAPVGATEVCRTLLGWAGETVRISVWASAQERK